MHSFVINTLCNLLPVLVKHERKYGPPLTRGPTSGKIGREIDCFVGTNLECVEAIVFYQSVIFWVGPEEVLDDLLAVEDVNFLAHGFDLCIDGKDVCADRDHVSLRVVHSVLNIHNSV